MDIYSHMFNGWYSDSQIHGKDTSEKAFMDWLESMSRAEFLREISYSIDCLYDK